jgi:hypothetical protein
MSKPVVEKSVSVKFTAPSSRRTPVTFDQPSDCDWLPPAPSATEVSPPFGPGMLGNVSVSGECAIS